MLGFLLDALYVPGCAACDARIGGDLALCAECAPSIYPIEVACPGCALPLQTPSPILCARCHARPGPLAGTTALYRYGGQLAVALHRLKYRRRPDIARALSTLITPGLAAASVGVDTIVPVPLHWQRHASRGYNQSQLLVLHAGSDLGVPIDTLSLRRSRPTRPQHGLDARARRGNVAGAFAVPTRRRRHLHDRTVLLCDDVMTTGATMRACARALLDAGARRVYGFCVARAER